MWRSLLLVIFLGFTKTEPTNSEEDSNMFLETNPYSPTTMNFNDIFAKSLTTLLLADQTTSSSTTEENFPLTIPTQYLDNIKTETTRISPPPRYYETSTTPRKSRRRKTTTEEYKDNIVVTTSSNEFTYQRGVLDLLFPAARVKSFKTFFDGFRQFLSHTFKK